MTVTDQQRAMMRAALAHPLENRPWREWLTAALDALDAANSVEAVDKVTRMLNAAEARAESAEAALEAGDACGAVGCRAFAERDSLAVQLDEALGKVEKAKAVLDCRLSNHHDYCDSWRRGFKCNCWRAELTAALAGPSPTDEGGES